MKTILGMTTIALATLAGCAKPTDNAATVEIGNAGEARTERGKAAMPPDGMEQANAADDE